jgi:hypothetical protein
MNVIQQIKSKKGVEKRIKIIGLLHFVEGREESDEYARC